jgi:uncharacterized protein (DUF302 family)
MIFAAAAMAALGIAISAAPAQPTKAAKPASAAAKAPADPSLVIRASANSVKDTLDRLAAAAEAKGAKVVARVDHAAGAKAVGSQMRATEVLVFGNPKLGTPLMLANPRAGLDLPLKVLAYEDTAGQVWLVYTKPAILQQRYRLKGKDADAAVKAVAAALDGLAGAAVAK